MRTGTPPPRAACSTASRRDSTAHLAEISEEESDAPYERWTIPSPARPLFQAAVANFAPHSEAKVNTDNDTRGPLLLISGLRRRDRVTVRTGVSRRIGPATTPAFVEAGVRVVGGARDVTDELAALAGRRPCSPPGAATS